MFDIPRPVKTASAILFRIGGAKQAATRARRIDEFVAMLARGETVYPHNHRYGRAPTGLGVRGAAESLDEVLTIGFADPRHHVYRAAGSRCC